MKAIKLTLLALIGFASAAFAQQAKVVIKTPTVICADCKERIEEYMQKEPGVISVNVNYKNKTTTIVYLTDRNDIEGLKTAISNAGYDADDIPANEDSYKHLPSCCKKGADNTKCTTKQ